MKYFIHKHRLATKIRISKLAIFSIVFGCFFFTLLFFFTESFGIFRLIKKCLLVITSILTILFASFSFLKIRYSNGLLKGKILISVSMFLFLSQIFVFFAIEPYRNVAYEGICATKMKLLGQAILDYSNDNNGDFPLKSKWYDLLIKHTDLIDEDFMCNSSFWPFISYGFNKNLDGLNLYDVPSDTVLLFEIKEGQGITGGPESVDGKKHYGSFSNVLLVDMTVLSIDEKKIGELTWQVTTQKHPNEPNSPGNQ